jgi:predicted ATPase
LPESLRQLIDHQLNRLSQEERGVIEVASVAGMEFSAAWVAAALETDVLEVESCCEALACRRLFLDSGKGPTGPERRLAKRYQFLHALHQHLLYERLPASRRRQLHRRVGESKETAFGSRRVEITAELAVHFEQGGDCPRAVHYLGQAAQNALRRSAGREASDLLIRALERLQTLPGLTQIASLSTTHRYKIDNLTLYIEGLRKSCLHETSERAQQELSLQVNLGAALLMSKGYTAPEVKCAYDRAHALCGQVGESPHLFPALFGLFRFELTRGGPQGARALAERLLRLAQAQPGPLLLPAAHLALGATLFHLGEPAAARTQVEQGLRAYDRHQQEALILQYGQDMGIMCLHYARVALQVLGYLDQALARSQEALALAEALSHSLILAHELAISAFFYQLRREGRTAQARAEAAIALVSEHGFSPLWGAYGTLARGWALAEHGQAEEGIAHMRRALGVLQTLSFHLGRPYNLGLLAEASGKAGRAQEGLAVLAEALATARRTGERWYEADLYRLKGELMLEPLEFGVPSPETEAEACFEQAIDIARRQGTRLFELRAAVSLGRLRMRQGKKQEACTQLAEVYGRFTEGLDTKDLREARALLGELG